MSMNGNEGVDQLWGLFPFKGRGTGRLAARTGADRFPFEKEGCVPASQGFSQLLCSSSWWYEPLNIRCLPPRPGPSSIPPLPLTGDLSPTISLAHSPQPLPPRPLSPTSRPLCTIPLLFPIVPANQSPCPSLYRLAILTHFTTPSSPNRFL